MTDEVLLSLDVEEFDLPLEYGRAMPEEERFTVSARGLGTVLELLQRLDLPATLFCTVAFAQRHPELIREAARRHEIASHGLRHDRLEPGDLERSRAILGAVTGGEVRGFRAPRMASVGPEALAAAGYAYDSSTHPTWLPGRYNRWRAPRRAHLAGPVLEIPASVTPLVRFPLFWLAFKNLPPAAMRLASAWVLAADGYLVLYFHPWEFADLSPYRLPAYVARPDGARLASRLASYLGWLARRARFVTMGEFARARRARLEAAMPAARGAPGPR